MYTSIERKNGQTTIDLAIYACKLIDVVIFTHDQNHQKTQKKKEQKKSIQRKEYLCTKQHHVQHSSNNNQVMYIYTYIMSMWISPQQVIQLRHLVSHLKEKRISNYPFIQVGRFMKGFCVLFLSISFFHLILESVYSRCNMSDNIF